MILRFLNPQGIAGLAAALCLAVLLALQHGTTSHWRKQSDEFEQLYRREEEAHLQSELNHRPAADAARAADRASAERVRTEQAAINQRTSNDLQNRLLAARAHAEQLRRQAAAAAAGPGLGRAAPVPAVPTPARQPDEATAQAGLSLADRLLATEQAIQLDELIKWVERQSEVHPNAEP
jgi:hypothetical protein